ncbi:uncharacterized protein LOC127752435 [Oryza glaberrima]|uniref:uncharacterized protein LOC127752435 n=1 Tax=Oryza glaberrima TaxID=4538 RepID=UPI00224C5907|nr:uncharacterized protein LOC127752435 [Oryza glaberrima]
MQLKRSSSWTSSGSNPQQPATDACKKQKSELTVEHGLFTFSEMGSEWSEGREGWQGLGPPQEFGASPFLVSMTSSLPKGFLMRTRVLVVDHDESNLTALSQMLIGFLCHGSWEILLKYMSMIWRMHYG